MTDQDKVTYTFDVLSQSEVSIKHLAELARVSRNTLHAWKRGAKGFDSVRVDMAYGVARRLAKAYEAGQLPLKADVKASEKSQVLRAIVRRVVL